MLLDEIKSTTAVEHRVDLYFGSLAICEILQNKVIFVVAGINVDATTDEFAQAVRIKFGGESEPLDSLSDKHNVIFSRFLDEPLRDPRSYLLSTQRKLIELIEEFYQSEAERSLMRGD